MIAFWAQTSSFYVREEEEEVTFQEDFTHAASGSIFWAGTA